jgi:type IV pilus assembly protein PilA
MENTGTPSAPQEPRLKRLLIAPRPFEGARWAKWVLGALGGCALALPLPVAIRTAFASAVVAILIMASFWEAHARTLMPGPSSHPALRFMLNVFSLCLWSVAFAIPLLFGTPAGGFPDYTPRAHISESILAASSTRTEISERYQSSQTLRGVGHGLSVPFGPRVASANVSEDGVIIIASNDPPAVITLTPSEDKKEGKLRWVCLGKPEKLMPASCRS